LAGYSAQESKSVQEPQSLKKITLFVAAALCLLLAVVVFRTFTYGSSSKPAAVINLPESVAFSVDDAVQHLSESIRFKTVTTRAGDPASELEAAPWLALHAWLAKTYPLSHAIMVRETVADYSLLYCWQGSDSSLAPVILMAHQDVVPVNEGTVDDWTGAPFAGDVIDGKVYGRGALDDKGSLVTIMEAGEALIASGFAPRRTVYFMFGHDEEVAGVGAQAMVDLLHSRGVRAELVLDEGFFVIKDSPLTGEPFGFIGVSEKGYATLEITAIGAGGHSSTPPRNSANVRLAKALLALENQQMPADFTKSPIAELFEAAAGDMGFIERMAFANQWLFSGLIENQLAGAGDAMIRTTTAPTMLTSSIKENVLPQRATATVNFRLHPNDSFDSLMAHVKDVTADIEGLEIAVAEGGIFTEASPVSPSDNKPFAVLSAVAQSVGGETTPIGPALVLGGTDARWAYKISDNVYRFYPSSVTLEEVAGFHGTNERLSVANVGRMVRGYQQLLLAMDAID